MSRSIFLDINDLAGSCHNNRTNSFARNSHSLFAFIGNCHNNRTNSFARNSHNLFAFIGRILFLSRSRLLKFFMAAVVVFLLIFFLFRASVTIPGNDFLDNSKTVQTNDKLQNKVKGRHNNDDLDLVQSHKVAQPSVLIKQLPSDTDQNSILIGKRIYPNNLTYLLTVKDFNQMKNINVMQVRIREAMKHSWDNYRKYAWGYDMLKPRAREPDHWFNLGLTIVESADTLIMMGMAHDSNLALDWIENELNFTTNSENSNCFELTIRILGGILSAYHLTARNKLKNQAIELGNILLNCYDTESRVVPYSDIDLTSHRAHPPQWNPHSSLSEVTSLQLEFRYLSQISSNQIYEQTTFKTSEHIHNLTTDREHKLLPMYISPKTGQLEESITTMGARTDSYYEYLLKQYLQTGIKWLEDDYLDAIDEVQNKLLRYTNGLNNFTYVAEMQVYRTVDDKEDIKYYNKMDHLVCFLPGTLSLGYYHFSPLAGEHRLKYNLETPKLKINSRYNGHLKMAKDLGRTCYHMYRNMGTGLSPEIAQFFQVTGDDPLVETQPALQAQSSATHNILRPEFVESLFYLYHVTGLPLYRKQAGEVFDAFEKYSRISSGYSPIADVRVKPPVDADLDEILHNHAPDRMESFWLSETLKYLYLIFCDDTHIVGTLLNNYVFNTEAHAMPIL